MVNRINRISYKILHLLYLIGKLLGIVVFIYDRRLHQAKISRTHQVLFPAIRSTNIVLYVFFVIELYSQYEKILYKVIFSVQRGIILTISILLIISQTTQSKKYISILNNTFKMIDALKTKLRSENFFDGTFFLFFSVKTLTNVYVIIADIPYILNSEYSWVHRLFILNMIVVMVANLTFFNFAFLGLLVTSAFQNNFYTYFQQCKKIKDFEEFSQIYTQFKEVFRSFVRLTQFQFLLAIVFYMVNIGALLGLIIFNREEYDRSLSVMGWQFCLLIDLMIFNMAADLVDKTSRKMNFYKVDFLCNDSLEVNFHMYYIFFSNTSNPSVSDGPYFVSNCNR